MTGVTPNAGAGPQVEDGPGTVLADRPDLPSNSHLFGLTAPAVVGAFGARAAAIALRLDSAGRDDTFELAILGEDASTLLRLGPFPEDVVVAVWRALGAASGLPLMIEPVNGRVRPLYPQVGPLLLGPVRIRRRHGLLNGRRPRFLVRRKTARLPPRPLVHREREMFARDKA